MSLLSFPGPNIQSNPLLPLIITLFVENFHFTISDLFSLISIVSFELSLLSVLNKFLYFSKIDSQGGAFDVSHHLGNNI